jgi:putative Ca2+/H+ antiporter (TMEM165/GDT1 family)
MLITTSLLPIYDFMDWFVPFTVTFAAVFLAELGDKTQLITISFASKYPRMPVFLGIFLGLSIITLLGVLVGTILFLYIPIVVVKVLSGLIFLLFGIWTLYKIRSREEEIEESVKSEKNIFTTSFLMISLAEFGDKTQFAVIALTAQYGSPIVVLLGAILAFALIVAIGVVLGKKISERVSSKWIEFGSGLLFIVIGFIFIIEAVLF